MNPARLLVVIIVLSLTGGRLFAQTPALDAGVAPHINLTAAQKQTVYQSIRKTQKNNAAPIGFRATIGAIVPAAITLTPVPETLADLMPETKGLETGLVEGEVVLVDPKSKQVVAVVVDPDAGATR
jgi:Protein of unknown function (DUF1236)